MSEQAHFRLIDDLPCEAESTFGSNFDPDEKKIVGHLLGLTFKADGKEITLEADIPVKDPENPSGELQKVIGVFDWNDWGGRPTDTFGWKGRVSPANQEKILEALSSGGGKNMDWEWKTYKYSDQEKTHFVHFSNGDSPIEMTLDTGFTGQGVLPTAEEYPKDPKNFKFTMYTKAIGNQSVLYASGVGANEQKQAGNALVAG